MSPNVAPTPPPDPGPQYSTPTNLTARQALHARFSTARVDWLDWVFERIGLATSERLLEIGCGNGALWVRNARRVPAGCRLLLTDTSAGMVEATRAALASTALDVRCEVMDAGALDVEPESIDVAVANHMLYHVDDRARAIAELRRVVRPGGRLVASTNGRAHMKELEALGSAFLPGFRMPDVTGTFGLENGEALLRAKFDDVVCERHGDALVVTEVDPLVDYVLSLPSDAPASADEIARLRAGVAESLAARGPLRITKDSGVFIAR